MRGPEQDEERGHDISSAQSLCEARHRRQSRKAPGETCPGWRWSVAVVRSAGLGSGENAPRGGLTDAPIGAVIGAGGYIGRQRTIAVGLHAVRGASG